MAYEVTGRRKPTKPKKQARAQKRKRDDVDVEKLEKAVADLDVKATFSKFTDLPLSEPTKEGLKASHFTTLTDIQARAISLGLKGHDILGAARTGSGKTLAFLIPVLENLYRRQCVGAEAGLGAMIISPTRELAIQIFDVLYKIGKHGHLFAAGLLIGGKSLAEEQQALLRMNIVVCTPGRMLQHLSQTASFSVDALQMLVLDEADRILDMGFQRDVDAILEYLPADRQTLLFSATQTKKVSDLARLSLNNPEYVSVHEAAAHATPKTLQQNYTVTPLSKKLDTLWSFLQSAKKSKILVFLSSAKQVRFVYEAFRRMQPGIPLLHLHGRQKQTARLDITTRFSKSKHICLFSTDVAARGIDYPAVDWVVQVDCPEDADTYIHRVGRTARYEHTGRAVLFLDPSEEQGMLERLAAKKVPIERINVRDRKQMSIRNQLQGLCFKEPELKYLGQKAFASYARSIHVQQDKNIFNLESYDMEEFASSLGLPGAPRIKFVKGDAQAIKNRKNAPRQHLADSDSDASSASDDDGKPKKPTDKPRTKYDRMFERVNQDILADHYTRMVDHDASLAAAPASDSDDGLLKVKRRIPAEPSAISDNDEGIPTDKQQINGVTIDSHRRAKALKSLKARTKLLSSRPTHMTFDEVTDSMVPVRPDFADEGVALGADEEERVRRRREFAEGQREGLKAVDVEDAAVAKAKRREKKMRAKEREKGDKGEGAEGDGGVERLNRRQRRAGMEVEGSEAEDGSDDGGLGVVDKPFEELADLYPSDAESDAQSKGKKFKPRESKGGKGYAMAEPQTLEDLEALARGVLG